MSIKVAFARRTSIERFALERSATLETSADMADTIVLSPALAGAADCLAETVHFSVVEIDVRHPEQGGHRLLGRIAEISLHDVSQHIISGALGRLGRIVNVARTIFLMAYQALFPKNTEHRSNSGVGGRVGEIAHDLGDGCAVALVKDVHDLALAAAQGIGRCGR